MVVFHFPQFEHEPFWQYLSRLNDYRAQYMLFMYNKWEICDVLLEGMTYETRAMLESTCYRGLDSLNVDEMWDLFESLASHQWQCECSSEAFVSPPSYDLHNQSSCIDQYRDTCDHSSSPPPLMHVLIANLLTMM